MVNCVVNKCARKADKAKGIRLFCIPSALKNQCAKTLFLSKHRRAFWIERINKAGLTLDDVKVHTRICSRHFVKGQPSALFDHKNIDWAPTLHMGYDTNILEAIIERQDRILCEGLSVLPVPQGPSDAPICSDAPIYGAIPNELDIGVKKEIVVCEVSVNDMLMDAVEETDNAYEVAEDTCEEKPLVSTADVRGDDSLERKQLLEEIEYLKSRLEEMQAREEDMHQKLIECNQDNSHLRLVMKVREEEIHQKLMESNQDNSHLRQEMNAREEEMHQKLIECNQDNCHLRHQVAALTADNDHWQKTVLLLFLNEDTLKDDDAKVAYYTGLPNFQVLMKTYELVSEKVPDSTVYALPKFQQFLLTLMRIRLNLQMQDLGYRFNISQATVSRVFYKWLVAMAEVLEKFISLPDRDTIIESTPLCFKKELGGSVGVIISCLEILTEKSTAIFSKSHTVKFLIGMTPQGTVYHTSSSYFGDSTIKIVEESGILDKLLPGDIVMMDKSFNKSGENWVKARVIESSTGKPELTDEKKINKNFVSVGFNIDRLCCNIKRKFSVLRSILHADYLSKKEQEEYSQIELVVRVCYGLANLCASTAVE